METKILAFVTDITKVCTKCSERKPLDAFSRDKRGKYGRLAVCKKCLNIIKKQKYGKADLARLKAYCKTPLGKARLRWHLLYNRCNRKDFPPYKYYGAKGITCSISKEEFVKWYLSQNLEVFMHPSVDRIDPDGNYELGNIRIMELAKNMHLGRLARKKRREEALELLTGHK